MRLPEQKRWFQAWLEGMVTEKQSTARPGVSSTGQEALCGAGRPQHVSRWQPLTIQLPLETSGQAWALVPFWVRAQEDI